MNLIFIGDIVGRPGREALKKSIGRLIEENSPCSVIANAENASGGLGVTPKVMEELLDIGVDFLTSGNHIWKRKEIYPFLAGPDIIRPANYPLSAPGRGCSVKEINGLRIGVINIIGRTFMEPLDSPFEAADRILEKLSKETDYILLDFHAEATSEKVAMGYYLDGRISAVLGTHTHVQTSDARILPNKTAYMTDAGMTGSPDGVIGVEKEEIVRKFTSGLPFSFKVAKGGEEVQGAVIKTSPDGLAEKIKSFRIKV